MAYNYDARMRESRLLIDQGLYAQAMGTLANVLENLYTDFYQQLLNHVTPPERRFLTEREEDFTRKGDKAARDQGFAGLTLGGKAKFFHEAQLIEKAQGTFNQDFPHFRTFDPRLFNSLRIETVHRDLVITEDEANLFYSQMRVLLLETGFLQRVEIRPESTDLSGLGDWKKNGIIPADDIREGNLQMDTYAADLWGVARSDPNTPAVYRDPQMFFQQTYLTASLESLIADVLRAMSGGSGDRVLQVRTPFGGGKTHSLIALYHVASSRDKLQKNHELAKLPDPGPAAVAAVQCEKFDVRKGHVVRAGLHIHTLWGEIAYQLAGEEGYAYLEESDKNHTAPGGETISSLLREIGSPVLILLDEVLNHVEAAQTVTVGHSTLGRQLMLFLKNLTEAVSASRNAALVYSLQASRSEALGVSGLLDDLDHLVSRIDAKRVPVSDKEVVLVVQRRLFQDLGEESTARRVASAYTEAYRRLQRAASLSPDEQQRAAREADQMTERILDSYPFHPDLLQLMYHRWGSRPSYQRTRGALQFLASVVYDLWHHGRDLQPLIGPGDVPLEYENTKSAFFTQVGERENYNSVLDSDISGVNAQAKHIDARIASDSPNLQQFRIGTRLATSAMLYSFGAQEGEERGISEMDLLKSVIAPGLDRVPLTAALADLRTQLLYLHYTGRRYRFETQPNLNLLIHRAKKSITADESRNRVRTVLGEALRDSAHAVIWPEHSGRVNDRVPALQVVYLTPDWGSFSDEELEAKLMDWSEFCGTSRRSFKNGLAFAIPGYHNVANVQNYADELLAIEQVIQNKRQHNLNTEMVQELNDRHTAAKSNLKAGVSVLYNRVAVPVPQSTDNAPYSWRMLQLNERREAQLEQQLIGALLDDYKLFQSVTVDKLIGLTQLGISGQNWLAIESVVTWFYSFLDFIRLTSAEVIRSTISSGVREGKFAYTAVFEVQGDQLFFPKPNLVYLGRDIQASEIDLTRAVLVTPELARELIVVPDDQTTIPSAVPSSMGSNAAPAPTSWSTPAMFNPNNTGQQTTEPQNKQRYHLQIMADKSKAFKAFKAIQNLVDRVDKMMINIEIEANRAEGFDLIWLRNAIEEPLDEADIEFRKWME